MALPMLYTIINAFKPLNEIFIFPPQFLRGTRRCENFYDLFCPHGPKLGADQPVPFQLAAHRRAGHGRKSCSSVRYAAYALAKHKFPGRSSSTS